ncbi:Gfo/Idh/MocA family oxidoreductase [uncultured Cyclobacterium sp.]|uniref:Gfo/Idh/MocA family protein n=1 Tax=uncultured Cyclobacterium sp. TaxID=453820 RepID=UPI0030EB7098|tara:strand:+ start:61381 stop:62385 length:1005 start_codon:yes stop_codon:yes gene_type:complete
MKNLEQLKRRIFLKSSVVAGLGLTIGLPSYGNSLIEGKNVGIIGLDTSHSLAFTKVLNGNKDNASYHGYQVVAAYPYGSKTIPSSADRIPDYINKIKEYNVTITSSIQELLDKVDVVLLETNDGRLHLEQAMDVFKSGKRVFIDKPVAASLKDAIAIFDAAKKYDVPVFSASSLRYIKGIEKLEGKIIVGADTYSPASLEATHPDLYWYGIHGVETLFTALGPGCISVTRTHTPFTDIVTGIWEDGKVGTFRGTRSGDSGFGGTVFTDKGAIVLGPYGGYEPLLKEITNFFETGVVPVQPEETLEILAFMTAADESKNKGGKSIKLADVMKKAR